ncbi:variant SH3 domain-containing protein [Natranaerovirga hydrolytica]|uniref:Variant SH3 domain-containing protein n=1 Tax=Natranaerovirga hydrolytica TaxID=680378 RepID=A0A4R1MN03_9FIRM|nr:SH3 domain-containing protein [Natranaerovirga hydrolytica]TCK92674.1 variant SH3 domain-containing protein [Natranaerovirga hydrolytica]
MNRLNKYEVIQSRKSDYPKPIQLRKGDVVQVGRASSQEDGWENWIYCTNNDISGWVPKQILESNENETGLIIEDYTARELEITKGEIIVSEKEMNGWVWGFKENEEDNKGWIPLENIKKMKE